MQLALYTDILERKSLSAGRRAFVWDVHDDEVPYDFTTARSVRNPRTLWDDYQTCLAEARAILADPQRTRPAYSSSCKLCPWYAACIDNLVKLDDLTLIPELGRPRRDLLIGTVPTVHALAACDLGPYIYGGKTTFQGLGPDALIKFQMRAQLLSTPGAKPYLRSDVRFPGDARELFFDIEVDPMRDVCYLHGFVERQDRKNSTERFVAFFSDACTAAAEREAFASAVGYIRASRPCAIYYYSKPGSRRRSLHRRRPEGHGVADLGFFDQDAREISRLRVARRQPVRRRLDRSWRWSSSPMTSWSRSRRRASACASVSSKSTSANAPIGRWREARIGAGAAGHVGCRTRRLGRGTAM